MMLKDKEFLHSRLDLQDILKVGSQFVGILEDKDVQIRFFSGLGEELCALRFHRTHSVA